MPDAASWLAVLHQHLNRRVVKAAEKGGGAAGIDLPG